MREEKRGAGGWHSDEGAACDRVKRSSSSYCARGNYAAKRALLSPPDRNSFGTETDPKPTGGSAPPLAWHTKSPNSLIYARKKGP